MIVTTDFKWDEWDSDTWDEVLTDCTSAGHQSRCVQAAEQLKFLDIPDVSQDVVRQVCRCGGPIDRLREKEEPREMPTIGEVLLHLAEVDTGTVADLLKRALIEGETPSPFSTLNPHVVQTLAKIAFKADTFEDGARLLFRLAAGNVLAKRYFVDIFNPLGGSTEADGTQRIELLDSVSGADNTSQLEIVVEALAAGLQIDVATRPVGPEVHGNRRLGSWYPETKAEACAYVQGCAQRLIDFAIRGDPVGSHARKVLGPRLDPLIRCRFMDVSFIEVVEQAVEQVGHAVDDWPEARDTLGRFLSDLSNVTPEEWVKQAQALRKKRVTWAKTQLKQLEQK